MSYVMPITEQPNAPGQNGFIRQATVDGFKRVTNGSAVFIRLQQG